MCAARSWKPGIRLRPLTVDSMPAIAIGALLQVTIEVAFVCTRLYPLIGL